MNLMPRISLCEGDAAAPTLVCLPGAMCSPQVFAEAAAHSGLTAVALAWLEDDGPHDLDAIAARVCAAISDLPSVILVGHSLGTPIAMLVALRELDHGSSRVRGMVLSNSGANTRGHGDIAGLIERIQNQWGEAFWDAFVARCFHALPTSPLLEHVRDYPARLRQSSVIEALRSQHSIDFAPVLSTLPNVPVAIVHGRHDPARTLAHAQEMVSGISNATLHILDTGHTSCAEDPVGFSAVLRTIAYEEHATR
jgi:pimeloyl-ACP methyl ester carboxylesterase